MASRAVGDDGDSARLITTRRALLGLTALAATGLVAGCSGSADPSPSASSGSGQRAHRQPGTQLVAEPVAMHQPIRRVRDLRPDAPGNAVALTLDDGPQATWTPRMLEMLHDFDVTATFFMIGAQVHGNEKLVASVYDAGHSIGNHTMHHPLSLSGSAPNIVVRELTDASNAIFDATGAAPRLFRSPGGFWAKTVLRAAADGGMLPVDWAVDSKDWSRPGTDAIAQRLLVAKAGDVMLCHDGGGDRGQTLDALKTVIPQLKDRGLTFVGL